MSPDAIHRSLKRIKTTREYQKAYQRQKRQEYRQAVERVAELEDQLKRGCSVCREFGAVGTSQESQQDKIDYLVSMDTGLRKRIRDLEMEIEDINARTAREFTNVNDLYEQTKSELFQLQERYNALVAERAKPLSKIRRRRKKAAIEF